MREARDDIDAGIEPEIELEERSLSMDEASVKSRLVVFRTRTGQPRNYASSDSLPTCQWDSPASDF